MGDRRSAITLYNEGIRQAQEARTGSKNFSLAYQLLSSSVLNDDTFSMGWSELGSTLCDAQQSAAAIAAHRLALELPPTGEIGDLDQTHRIRSLVEIGHRLQMSGREKEGRPYILQAIELAPDHPQAYCCLSLCQSISGEHEAALVSAKKAHELAPDNATFEFALALAYMYLGNYRDGFRHIESRFRYRLHHFLSYPYPQWKGEPGKKVYLVTDQGLGDALSFARYIPAAAKVSKFLYVCVQKELVRLLKASFQNISNIDIVPVGTPFPPADCWTTFPSIPSALDMSEEDIRNTPNVPIPPFSVGMNWKSPDRKIHIGVSWKGSPASDIAELKNFPIEELLRLYEIPGVCLYSLQVGPDVAELHNKHCAALIRDLSPYINDAADSAAIVRQMDLVVTVESFLGHLAGACDVETFIPYGARARDYRAGHDGSKPLWYPKHRFFKQGDREQWSDVFGRIVEALRWRVK